MNNPDTYILKPKPFYAFIWTGNNLNELKVFLSAQSFNIVDNDSVTIDFGEYTIKAKKNYFICTKEDGTYEAVNSTVFSNNYQRFIIPSPETQSPEDTRSESKK